MEVRLFLPAPKPVAQMLARPLTGEASCLNLTAMGSSNEHMRLYMKERYDERKKIAFDLLGGRCANCGSTENLDIDHVDRKKKTMATTRMTMVRMVKFIKELSLCQLLCKSCHIRKTIEERGNKVAVGTHGTLSALRWCKPPCQACRDAKNKWNREWKKKKKLGASPSGLVRDS